MVYIRSRKVKGKMYNMLVKSIKKDGKVKQIFLKHIGKGKLVQEEKDAIINSYFKKDVVVVTNSLVSYQELKEITNLTKEIKEKNRDLTEIEKEKNKERFNVNFIYNSNSIEGNSLTKEQVYSLTHDGVVPEGKTLKEIHETENMQEALKFIDSYKEEISEKFIKKLHSIVQKNIEKETLGKYKIRQNYIAGSDHLPTPPVFVKERMRDLVDWYHKYKKKLHPMELSSAFHIKFLVIHPFTDGNGRTARLIQNKILKDRGYLSIIFPVGDKLRYYAVIKNALQGSAEPFIKYMLKLYKKSYT